MPNAAAPLPKPPQSEGTRPNDREWLYALGIPDGEFLFETKPRLRRIQQSASWPYKARIYANLALHTMAFRQELAIRMEIIKHRDKQGRIIRTETVTLPHLPKHIAEETKISKQNVRRTLRELEAEGFCRTEGLHKGARRVYAYAVPREPAESNLVVSLDYQIPDGMPPEAYRRMRRLDLKLPPDLKAVNGHLPGILVLISDCQKALAAAREAVVADYQNRLLAVVNAQEPHAYNKEERKEEKDIYIEASPPPPPFVDNTTTAEDEEPPENIKPEPPKTKTQSLEEFKAEYPPDHWDDRNASEAYKQHIKSRGQHEAVMAGLRKHKAGARWNDADGQWIPFASKFIKARIYEYEADPKITLKKPKQPGYSIFDMIREQEEKDKAKGASS